jgi:predicted nucleic acid-binding protein
MNTTFVLDAWAILALLQKEEPAASRVLQLLQESNLQGSKLYISIINLGEVYYRIGRVKGRKEADQTLKSLYQLPITILPATDQTVLEAASLKMELAISYADAFAAAETQRLKATLVTGDPELIELKGVIRIEKLKRRGH